MVFPLDSTKTYPGAGVIETYLEGYEDERAKFTTGGNPPEQFGHFIRSSDRAWVPETYFPKEVLYKYDKGNGEFGGLAGTVSKIAGVDLSKPKGMEHGFLPEKLETMLEDLELKHDEMDKFLRKVYPIYYAVTEIKRFNNAPNEYYVDAFISNKVAESLDKIKGRKRPSPRDLQYNG